MPTKNEFQFEAELQDSLAEAATDEDTRVIAGVLADIAREQAETERTRH